METGTPYNSKARLFVTRSTTALLRILRSKETGQERFACVADRLCRILAEEALASLDDDSEDTSVETPCGLCIVKGGRFLSDEADVVIVDIMRSGAILMEAARRLAPSAKTAKILIQRNETTAEPLLLYSKLPPNINHCEILLCDPMLATGGSACAAIDVLKRAGVDEKKILFVNIVTCPEGLRRLAQHAPHVRIITTAIDPYLNENFFIVPGLGDFGDRYFGTFGYAEGLWGSTASASRGETA